MSIFQFEAAYVIDFAQCLISEALDNKSRVVLKLVALIEGWQYAVDPLALQCLSSSDGPD